MQKVIEHEVSYISDWNSSQERQTCRLYGSNLAQEIKRNFGDRPATLATVRLEKTTEKEYKHAERAAAIAAALPGEWTAEPISEERADCDFFLIRKSDGLKLFMDAPGYAREHAFHFGTCTPRDRHGRQANVSEDRPSMNCGETKTPFQMAKDIQRRILEDAGAYHAACVAAIARSEGYADAKDKTIRNLAAVLGEQVHKNSMSGEGLWHQVGDWTVSGPDSIKCDRYFTLEETVAVIRLLKGGAK